MKIRDTKFLNIVSYAVLYFFFPIFSLHAESSIWKIEHNGKSIYVGGTVHYLKEADYPLPPEFEMAYKDAKILVLELNPDEMDKDEMQKYMRENGSYKDDRSLRTVLSEEVYQEFRKYCKDNGISVMGLNKLKPAILILNLFAFKMKAINASPGVDRFFFEKAKTDSKKVIGLETFSDQMEIIVSMGEGHESEFVYQSLLELSLMDKMLDELISIWRSGNLQKVYELQIKKMQTDSPDLYKSMLLDRNNKWIPKIEKLLETPETEIVLVGDAHLAGPDGLIEVFQKKGYNVTQVKTPK